VQRGMPVAGPPGMTASQYQTVMTRALRLLARVPGLR